MILCGPWCYHSERKIIDWFDMVWHDSNEWRKLTLKQNKVAVQPVLFWNNVSNLFDRPFCLAARSFLSFICHIVSNQLIFSNIHVGFIFILGCRSLKDVKGYIFTDVSSKKLLDAGFQYKYGIEEMFDGAIQSCKEKGYL